jgi:hypothetical protein
LNGDICERLVKCSVQIFNNKEEENLYTSETVRDILTEFFDNLKLFGNLLSESIINVFMSNVITYFDSFVSRTILLWLVNIENIFKFCINNYRSLDILLQLSSDNDIDNEFNELEIKLKNEDIAKKYDDMLKDIRINSGKINKELMEIIFFVDINISNVKKLINNPNWIKIHFIIFKFIRIGKIFLLFEPDTFYIIINFIKFFKELDKELYNELDKKFVKNLDDKLFEIIDSITMFDKDTKEKLKKEFNLDNYIQILSENLFLE